MGVPISVYEAQDSPQIPRRTCSRARRGAYPSGATRATLHDRRQDPKMRAIQIERPGVLRSVERAEPQLGPNQILLRVHACGVCGTDLHLLGAEVEITRPPIVPGHQIVGTVIAGGERAESSESLAPGTRVGIPPLGWACGRCLYLLRGPEEPG